MHSVKSQSPRNSGKEIYSSIRRATSLFTKVITMTSLRTFMTTMAYFPVLCANTKTNRQDIPILKCIRLFTDIRLVIIRHIKSLKTVRMLAIRYHVATRPTLIRFRAPKSTTHCGQVDTTWPTHKTHWSFRNSTTETFCHFSKRHTAVNAIGVTSGKLAANSAR